MKRHTRRYPYVLAVYPNSYGVSFVLFESPLSVVDWGITRLLGSDKNKRSIARTKRLLKRYDPEVLVIQDVSGEGARRSHRINALHREIARACADRGTKVFACSRTQVFDAFSQFDINNKHDIAEVIARKLPTLARYLPLQRKAWLSENRRMGLFDAAALALTYFVSKEHITLKPISSESAAHRNLSGKCPLP